jgi:hypothetical protein
VSVPALYGTALVMCNAMYAGNKWAPLLLASHLHTCMHFELQHPSHPKRIGDADMKIVNMLSLFAFLSVRVSAQQHCLWEFR